MKTLIIFVVNLSLLKNSCELFAQITFVDVAQSLGIDHTYNWPFFNAGLSFCDFDKDGYEDITLPTATGEKIHLYKFNGTSFTNIIDQTTIDDTMRVDCVLWADYDNDGDRDFFLTNRNSFDHLYRNDGGQFVDVTVEAGLPTSVEFSSAACWADYDRDGWLDLYVGTRDWNLGSNLYHNNSDGTFTDVTDFAGVSNFGKLPLAISFLDYNNDGWLDIYNANDLHQGNTLFKNNGDGTFSDVSVESGANVYVSGMGIAIGDYDNNDYLDIYITNIDEGNAFLHNNGDGTFTEKAGYLHIDVGKFGWGTSFFDYDNDSDLDLLVNNSGGLQGRDDPNRNNSFFRNNGDGKFTELFDTGLESDTFYSYGSAIADFNNDGYLDVAILNAYGHKSQLFQNSGGSNNWIKLSLEGTISNKEAIGSVIEIWRNGSKFIRTTHCGTSYDSQDSYILTIGVGTSTVIDSIRIIWPSGLVDLYRDVSTNKQIFAIEGETLVVPPPVSFTDVTDLLRINHSYSDIELIGGVSFADANNDGLDDITFSSAMEENIQHLRNRSTNFKNFTNRMGIIETTQSQSVLWADYDNDRDKDLFIVNYGSVSNLYRNDRGFFNNVTMISGLSLLPDLSSSASFADYDNDGYLDLYVGLHGENLSNRLYHNNKNGTFTEVTANAKVSNFNKYTNQTVWFDFNNDGLQDIYCLNDSFKTNSLYKNNGDGTFTDISMTSGAGLAMICQGIAIGDYNNDGWLDLYLTDSGNGNKFLENNCNETFSEISNELNLEVNKNCYGTNFLDYDNDGYLDLLISVADKNNIQTDNTNILFWNNGIGSFYQVIDFGILSNNKISYGNAIGDYNNDGYPDIVILNADTTKSQLLKNEGWSNNWIKIKLVGNNINRDAIGSRISVYSDGRAAHRQVINSIGYRSQNSLLQTIGLGSVEVIDSVIIHWPSGEIIKLTSLAVNQTLTINEGNISSTTDLSLENLKIKSVLPREYSLNQNYPNPFNPVTVIGYQLPEESVVKIEVFNIIGQTIKVFELGKKDVGSHSLEFNGIGLPSGIYLFKITAGQYTESKKMILVK